MGNTKGTKGLLKRLKVHTPKKAAAPTSATDSETTQAETEAEAEISLQRELAHELEIEDADEQLVGNHRGLNRFEAGRAIAARIAAQDARIAAQDARIATQESTIALLLGLVTDLTTSHDAYKALRNRFISTYKRDVLINQTETDRRILAAGITLTDEGDAVGDALLYQLVGPGARRDYFVFKKLYGLDPGVLRLLSERDVAKII